MEVFMGLILGLLFGYFWGKGSGRDRGVWDERSVWAESLGLNTLDSELREIIDDIKNPISIEDERIAKDDLKKYIYRNK